MATFEFSVKELIDMYKRGFEDAFLMMNDSTDLDETLNINNITTEDDAE